MLQGQDPGAFGAGAGLVVGVHPKNRLWLCLVWSQAWRREVVGSAISAAASPGQVHAGAFVSAWALFLAGTDGFEQGQLV